MFIHNSNRPLFYIFTDEIFTTGKVIDEEKILTSVVSYIFGTTDSLMI